MLLRKLTARKVLLGIIVITLYMRAFLILNSREKPLNNAKSTSPNPEMHSLAAKVEETWKKHRLFPLERNILENKRKGSEEIKLVNVKRKIGEEKDERSRENKILLKTASKQTNLTKVNPLTEKGGMDNLEKKEAVTKIGQFEIIAKGKINVYTYTDVFTDRDNLNLYWNPLFPRYPHESYFMPKLEDEDWIRSTISRRLVGFLHIRITGFYTFRFESRNGLDLVLFKNRISKDTVILRFGLTKAEMSAQNVTGFGLYMALSKEVWLERGRAYPIDITHSCTNFGRFKVEFKRRGDSSFKVVDASYLSPLHEATSLNISMPNSFAYAGGASKLRVKFNNDKRIHFGSRVQMSSKTLKTGLDSCSYEPSYIYKSDIMWLYYGQQFVAKDRIYPYDHSDYSPPYIKFDRLLNESIAKSVAQEVFAVINKTNNGIYKLQNIVHVEENADKKRYFVELDLKSSVDGKVYRLSEYFLKPSPTSKLCLPEGYQKWDHQASVYLICVVKNQRRWFSYLIQSLEDLIKRTNDQNLHLVTVDFNSTDANLRKLLEKSKLNFTFLQLSGNFSKVVGLNEGVRRIPSNDSIVFVMDLQLQIPDHIFDQARKHTIQGKMTYCPTLIRLDKMQHPEYTAVTKFSAWMDIGYGMMSIYKSDWNRIGGMNEKLYKYKWGGEDWEFVDRVMTGRLELVHQRLPGFYHIYHSTLGTWDGTKLY